MIKYTMIFEGVNDIGTAILAAQQMVSDCLMQVYQRIIAPVHTFGFSIFTTTIFGAPHDTPQPYLNPLREQTWVQIHDWIMWSGAFDTVIDFASIRCGSVECDAIESGVSFLHSNVVGSHTATVDALLTELFKQYAFGMNGGREGRL